jgi:predicted AlkP superfamily pyrophosphatase or phosphodiesterase
VEIARCWGTIDREMITTRRITVRRSAMLVLFLAAAACGRATPHPAPTPVPRASRTVIVLGFDGFARRYLDADSAPALHALARSGVTTARGMIPSFPTVTFSNFYALATGLYPDHSGIVNNRFYDPAYDSEFVYKDPIAREAHGWGGEPIWLTAEKQGARSGTMYWVGSDAAIGGTHPSHWHTYDRTIAFSARVDTLLAWLDLPAAERPRLLMGYFEEPDMQGHRHGPDGAETREAVLRVDSALARLVSGLESRTMYDSVDIIVVADHGMSAISPERVIYLDDVLDSASVNVVNITPNLMIDAKDGDDEALLARLRKLPHLTVWKKQDVPARLHYGASPRITSIVGVADDGWMIGWRHAKPYDSGGEHGYDNAVPNMRALFLARGPDFRPGSTIAEFPNVDVYDLLARLLGIDPAPNDGTLAPFLSVLR